MRKVSPRRHPKLITKLNRLAHEMDAHDCWASLDDFYCRYRADWIGTNVRTILDHIEALEMEIRVRDDQIMGLELSADNPERGL